MASSDIGGRYQQCEYLKVISVFTGAKPNRASAVLASQHHLANRCFSGYDTLLKPA
jgi:hypothetical protein